MRIIQIADIHWKGGTSRHEEYRKVFKNFYDKAKKLAPDVIYIGGDIFHTKTQNISPEVLDCLGWWFTEMATIAHVVVTLGNHDGNLMNLGRQDAISPIIRLLNNPRITLYKESGVYKSTIPGVNWCVFSCFDEKNWENVKPVPNEINIASFHGSVRGSTTDSDFMLKSDVSVDFFDGYDFALLGDIHKKQYLAYRDCVDGQRKPWMGYCGSTIQQNYGESLEHGFLVWDIRARDDFDVEFEILQNPSQYVTIDWNGEIDDVLKFAADYNDGARFRIRSKSIIPHADWRSITHALKINKNASEVIQKVVDKPDASVIDERYSSITNDLRDSKEIIRLLHEYYTETVTQDEWNIITSLVEEYVKQLNEPDSVVRNSRWVLEQLEFDNTFGYGCDNFIDFSKLSGITGIFAGNAMGKSSIIGTMMYALFNATDRGPMKNLHVINTNRDYCSAKAIVSIDNVKHEIVRSSKKQTTNNGFTHAITTLDFKKSDTDESFNGEQRTVTEKYVRQHIGSADDFMLTSLAVQGGLKTFINEGAAQRKSILSRFLDLQLFEQIHDIAKKDSAAIKLRIKDMPERDWSALKTALSTRRQGLFDESLNLERNLCTLRNDLAEKQLKIAGFGNVVYVTQADIDAKKEAVADLEKKYRNLILSQDEINAAFDAAKHRVEIVERVKSKFPLKMHLEKESAKKELEEWIFLLEQKLKTDNAEIITKEKSVLKLAEVPCDNQFPMCKYIRDSHDDRNSLPNLQKLIDQLRNEIGDKKRSLTSVLNDGSLSRLTRYRRIVSNEQRYKLQVSEITHKLSCIEHDINNVGIQCDRERNELEELKVHIGKSNASIEQRRLKNDIDDIQQTINMTDTKRMNAATSMGRIDSELEQLDVENAEYQKLASEWRAYEKLINAMSKGGIPSKILRQLTPTINDEISRILNGIVNFTIQLELPDDSNEMNVYINYGEQDENRRIIELGSGMEKMIASIAIRVALINISSLPKTDMFIIDEGFSELDETNIDACGLLLRSLTRWFRNIIIITHIDTLKDVVDNVIDITRNGAFANVSYV